MTAPDQVLISGVLQSGAVASVHLKGGTSNGTAFLFATYIEVSEFTVRGAQAGKLMAMRRKRVSSSGCPWSRSRIASNGSPPGSFSKRIVRPS